MENGFRVPARIDFADGAVSWQGCDGARFSEPFFDDTVRRLRIAGLRDAPATPLAAWAGPAPARTPDAVILHVSRCGSTLVSQMLASLPSTLVVSEARVFDDILRARQGDPAIADDDRERWLRHAAAAFAASQAEPPARLVLKLDCWHLFALEGIRRAFPRVPLLFVYRDPLEVLVSLMRRPSWTTVRDTVTAAEIGITVEMRDALTPEAHAAAVLGAFFRQAARHRADLIPVAYTALPSLLWSGLPALGLAPDDVARLRDAASRDAKAPERAFVPDAAAKRAEATPALVEACARWAGPSYEAWLASV